MSNAESHSGAGSRRWTFLAAGMAAVVLWVAAVEVPDRLGRIGDVRAQTAGASARHTSALDQRAVLAQLHYEQARLEERLVIIAGEGHAAAGPAAVLDRIEDAIDEAGLTLLEMRPLEGERGGAYARLPIQLKLAGSFEGLRSFLRRIETGVGAMPVREVAIRGGESTSPSIEADVIVNVVVVERSHPARGAGP